MNLNPKALYQASCTAFGQGNYPRARLLASQCLSATPRDTYLYYAALSLKCWSANYQGDTITVEREAALLLEANPLTDKRWFEALALYNLGLVQQRTRHAWQAATYFNLASQRYAAYKNGLNQPRIRILTNRFFAALTHWGATGDRGMLAAIAKDISDHPVFKADLNHLAYALGLYLRRTEGEDVTCAAANAASHGVDRTLLAYLLLEPRPARLH